MESEASFSSYRAKLEQCWILQFSKWFEPRGISSLSSVIVRVSVVLKGTVGDSD